MKKVKSFLLLVYCSVLTALVNGCAAEKHYICNIEQASHAEHDGIYSAQWEIGVHGESDEVSESIPLSIVNIKWPASNGVTTKSDLPTAFVVNVKENAPKGSHRPSADVYVMVRWLSDDNRDGIADYGITTSVRVDGKEYQATRYRGLLTYESEQLRFTAPFAIQVRSDGVSRLWIVEAQVISDEHVKFKILQAGQKKGGNGISCPVEKPNDGDDHDVVGRCHQAYLPKIMPT